ncbi:MAG: hypothetical protein M1814_001683 [Vezdaea aestivalis]|nr:MAG: hypothetical protein M1814_001683 [Vezdaea aestivalis]
MPRPEHFRAASSTNLGSGHISRPLEGKLAIVTGSSRGIGAAIATNLASKGCSVVLNYTSDSSASKASSHAEHLSSSYSVQTLPVQADLGSERGPAHLVEITRNHFAHPKTGTFQIDILVNNAGVSANQPLGKIDCEEFARQYNVNVRGPLLLVQAAVPFLPNDRSGRIVNISSISSSLGLDTQSVYGGTKAALEAMTRTWARELAEKATVNAVNPGPVDTDMFGATGDFAEKVMKPHVLHTPLAKVVEADRLGQEIEKLAVTEGGRRAQAEEIAGVVGMLCSAESAWCTGSVVCANGGMKMSA